MITFDRQAWYFFRRWTWLRWRVRNAQLKHVLRAMLWLNRSAFVTKRSYYADKTYALKSDLLRYLYGAGLVDQLTKQEQTLACSFCGGDGKDPYAYDDDWDSCRKCDGTGIYRKTTLVKFRVGRYVWHQPAPLVDWLNIDSIPWDERCEFQSVDERGIPLFSSAKLREHWFAVVVMYLWRHGVNVQEHQLAPFVECFDWHTPRWWKRLLKFKVRRSVAEAETISDIPF